MTTLAAIDRLVRHRTILELNARSYPPGATQEESAKYKE
jgi:hypothetical protein